MEIYTNSASRRVSLKVPVAPSTPTADVTVEVNGVPVYEFNTVTYLNGEFSVVLPFAFVQNEANLAVRWSFTYTEDGENYLFDKATQVEVVEPVLSEDEIKKVHPNATAEEIVRIEKATRHIINTHTGQRFGRFVGTNNVRGSGGKALQLPSRLLQLTAVNGDPENLDVYEVGNDGWTLTNYPWGAPPVKADFYGYHQHVGGVIHNPNAVKLGYWREGTTYSVSGVWGWESVPEAVQEAAKLLVNDYACGDAAYRDRYLTSMTAADWRIQFHSGAFLKTGNVRADQLLSNYVLQRGWAVI